MKLDKLLIATHNPGKFKETSIKLGSLNIKTFSLDDLNIKDDFEETGQTYEENAEGKARFYYRMSGIPTLADDSGLSVDALNGEPGVHSRNWAGYRGTDEELLQMLLIKLEGVPLAKRTARFVTVMALFDGDRLLMSRGEVSGIIAEKQIVSIQEGLPYSCVFYPEGNNKVFSQLSVAEKNKISQRGRALDSMIKLIRNND